MKVSTRVCDTPLSMKTFRFLADKIITCTTKEEVQTIFNVLAGELPISSVNHLLTEEMKDGNLNNENWRKLQNWKKWWTREEHLSKCFLFSIPSLSQRKPPQIARLIAGAEKLYCN